MAESTENTILEVARRQFVQKGFAGTRMQEIADEAGINKAMLHYYFRSKEKLYEEIIDHTLNNFIPEFAGAFEKAGPFWEKVERIVETYINILVDHPEIPFFIMSEISQKRENFVEKLKKRAVFFPAVQSFMGQMMEEMQAGNIKTLAPGQLFLNLMGMMVFPFIAKPIYCTIFELPEKDFDLLMEERKEVIVGFMKNALRPD